MASVEVSLQELRQMAGSGKLSPRKTAPAEELQQFPMFVPVNTAGLSVFNITNRQKFLDKNIGIWREWHAFRAYAIGLALLTLYLIIQNQPYLAAVSGLGAGWYYGMFVNRVGGINRVLKGRSLYEVG
jgi:hypothetical protein